MNTQNNTVVKLAETALLAALCYVSFTFLQIKIPVRLWYKQGPWYLQFCIGLIVGLVAHKVAKINESTDKKYVFKWSVIASVAGLAFNVIADPIVGYFYKQYILGQPQELAQALAKMSAAATFINAIVSVILVAIIYNAVRPVLIKSHLITVTNNKNQVA